VKLVNKVEFREVKDILRPDVLTFKNTLAVPKTFGATGDFIIFYGSYKQAAWTVPKRYACLKKIGTPDYQLVFTHNDATALETLVDG